MASQCCRENSFGDIPCHLFRVASELWFGKDLQKLAFTFFGRFGVRAATRGDDSFRLQFQERGHALVVIWRDADVRLIT